MVDVVTVKDQAFWPDQKPGEHGKGADEASNYGSDSSHDGGSYLELDINSFGSTPLVAAILPDSPPLYNPFMSGKNSSSARSGALLSTASEKVLRQTSSKQPASTTKKSPAPNLRYQRDDSAFAEDSPPPVCSTSTSDDDNNQISHLNVGRGGAAGVNPAIHSAPAGNATAGGDPSAAGDPADRTKDIIADLDSFISQLAARKPRLAEYKDVIIATNRRIQKPLPAPPPPPPPPVKKSLTDNLFRLFKGGDSDEEEVKPVTQAVRKKGEGKKKARKLHIPAGGVIPLTSNVPRSLTKSPKSLPASSPTASQKSVVLQMQTSLPYFAAAGGKQMPYPYPYPPMYPPYGMLPFGYPPTLAGGMPGIMPGMPGVMPGFPFGMYPYPPPLSPPDSPEHPHSSHSKSKSRSSDRDYSPPRAKNLSRHHSGPETPSHSTPPPAFSRSRSYNSVPSASGPPGSVPSFGGSSHSRHQAAAAPPSASNPRPQMTGVPSNQPRPQLAGTAAFRASGGAPSPAGKVPGFAPRKTGSVPGFNPGGRAPRVETPPPEPEPPKAVSLLEMFAAHKAKFGHPGEEVQEGEEGGLDSKDSNSKESSEIKGDSIQSLGGEERSGEIRERAPREAVVISDSFNDMPMRGPGDPRPPRDKRHAGSPSSDPLSRFQHSWKTYRTMRNHFYDMDPRNTPRPSQSSRRGDSPDARPVFYTSNGKGPSPPRRGRSPPRHRADPHRSRSQQDHRDPHRSHSQQDHRDPRYKGHPRSSRQYDPRYPDPRDPRHPGRHSYNDSRGGRPLHSTDSASSLTDLARRHPSSGHSKEEGRGQGPRRVQSYNGGIMTAY